MRAVAYSTEMVIHRPAQDVFDYCSDLRSELQWNPKVKYVQKLTEGPVGVGTRYRAQWSNSGPTPSRSFGPIALEAGRPT
jgi:hypothetical protein